MCYDNNIDDLMQRIQACADMDEMRRLLQEAHSCRNCPEEEKQLECEC